MKKKYNLNLKNFFLEIKFCFLFISISITLTFFILYFYKYELLYLITKPLIFDNKPKFHFIFTNIFDMFTLYLYICLFFSILFNIFYINLLLLKFNIIGLYKYEYYHFLIKIIAYTIFIFLINFLFYIYLYPQLLNILLNFEINLKYKPIVINLELKINEYINNFIFIILLYNLNLYLSIILFKNKLNKKIIYICLMLIIAILTPPDILSLFLLILPIIIFLEIFHIILKIKKYYF